MSKDIESLQAALRQFAIDRDWEQFHSPKNLASALSVEAAELLEHFQWLTDAQSRDLPIEDREKIGHEIADVFLYLLQIADKLDLDMIKVAYEKLQINASKYPVERSKGSSTKYTKL